MLLVPIVSVKKLNVNLGSLLKLVKMLVLISIKILNIEAQYEITNFT